MKRADPAARTDVAEILRTAPAHFTPMQIRVLRAVCRPEHHSVRDLARELGVTEGTMKVYASRLYDQLSMAKGSLRRLALYGIAHRELLGIKLPTQEDFYDIPGVS